MEKSAKVQYKSNQLDIDVLEPVVYVKIRSLLDAKEVHVTGTVTGNLYIFYGAGGEASVDSRDKDAILNKKRGRACCGGNSFTALFELVEE